jgi:feruloyl-CoA synthase
VNRYRDAQVGGCVQAVVEQRADGSTLVRSTEALLPFPQRITDHLEHWAHTAPDRTFVAKRDGGGDWRRIGYGQMLARAQAVGQSLLDLGLSAERPLAILSGNDIEHLTLALGALWAGVPYVPVSTAYSLVSQDFGKLRYILGKVTPGLVFASDASYAKAIDAVVPGDVTRVVGQNEFDRLLAATPGPTLAAAHAQVGADTIAKLLFTSGSTKDPKGVMTTHRMLCANQQMIRQCLGFLANDGPEAPASQPPPPEGVGSPGRAGSTQEPPVLVDWLPWSHVFGGSHNVGIALYNGGTLYIDDGKPTPSGMRETLRNLREISPTIYFNVPKGLEEIATAMDSDTLLRDTLFQRCKAIMFAGAAMSQPVWDKLHAHAEAAVGERVRVITGLGMTETAPSCTFAVGTAVASGHIGLPVPGVETKLVPVDGKLEIRFRGPNVMPGYWRAPEQSAAAFDDEGFYRTGDAVRWIDAAEPQRGLLFDGRTAEDFKLSTGTFVSVGPLRAKIVAAGDPCVQDAVITGLNRDEVGALLFPRADECRRIAGLPADTPLPEVLHDARVRIFFQVLADRLWRESSGSANRVARLHVLAEPPSIDKGEVTDKGSINQRAVLAQRDALVQALYEGRDADPFLILPSQMPH